MPPNERKRMNILAAIVLACVPHVVSGYQTTCEITPATVQEGNVAVIVCHLSENLANNLINRVSVCRLHDKDADSNQTSTECHGDTIFDGFWDSTENFIVSKIESGYEYAGTHKDKVTLWCKICKSGVYICEDNLATQPFQWQSCTLNVTATCRKEEGNGQESTKGGEPKEAVEKSKNFHWSTAVTWALVLIGIFITIMAAKKRFLRRFRRWILCMFHRKDSKKSSSYSRNGEDTDLDLRSRNQEIVDDIVNPRDEQLPEPTEESCFIAEVHRPLDETDG